MAVANLTLKLFASVVPVNSPGSGSGRVGANLLQEFTAAGNNPIATDSVLSDATDTWDFSQGTIAASGIANYVVAGETAGWPAQGWLIECTAEDLEGDTTGYAEIDDGSVVRELHFGGLFFYVKGSGETVSDALDVTFDALSIAHENLKVNIYAIC